MYSSCLRFRHTLTSFKIWDRRIWAALHHPDTRQHAFIIHDLGAEAMSSDESDHESGVPQYHVLIHAWRNPVLTPFLRAFDAIYRRSRFAPITQNTRGAHPHIRFMSGRRSTTRRIPPGRPVNAYDPRILHNMTDDDFFDLRVEPAYDFSLTPAVQQYVSN